MVLRKGKKSHKYEIEESPNIHLLTVLGIRRGIQVTIQSKQMFGGPIVVKAGNRSIAIASNVADEILVREVV